MKTLLGKAPFTPLYVLVLRNPDARYSFHEADEAYQLRNANQALGHECYVVETAE